MRKSEIVKLNYILDNKTDINEKLNVEIKYNDELDGNNIQKKNMI